jgi:hypothetical protein
LWCGTQIDLPLLLLLLLLLAVCAAVHNLHTPLCHSL